jgi:hypothetical protein
MAPLLCGRQLSPADRRVWKQASALLVGRQRRNGFGETDLAAAVGTAVRRGAARPYCEDCGVKVTGGATINSGRARRAIPILAWPPIYIESPASYDVNEI